MKRKRGIGFIVVSMLLLAGLACGDIRMDVNGVGWRTGKRFERLLSDVMDTAGNPDASLDATKVEDAILVLRSELNRSGFLSPEIQYTLYSGADELGTGKWSAIPGLKALDWSNGDRLVFQITRGSRAFFESVDFKGLTVITQEEAQSFFIPPGGVLLTKGERIYSPARLDRGLQSLIRRLGQLGYPEADAYSLRSPAVTYSGEVGVEIKVEQGPLFVWGEVSIEGVSSDVVPDSKEYPVAGSVFNIETLQDWIALVRRQHLVAGFPDVKVSSEQEAFVSEDSGQVTVRVHLTVDPGLRVRLGSILFDGLEITDESFLRHLVDLDSGDWLNRSEVQAAQFKLGQLGVFSRVQTLYQADTGTGDEPIRSVRFAVEERERKELSFLVGYGSYERIRIGLEARALNMFGRAHSGHIRLRQSMRSSAGALLYSIPRPTPWLSSGQIRLQGLLREEVSFDREEALAAIGVERLFREGSLRTTVEYRYELLRSKGFESSILVGDSRATAGSLNVGFGWDTRDRLMAPRKGASFHGQVELASPSLGSEAYYQRFLLRSSYHRSFNQDRLRWHFGFEGGVLARLGSEVGELPTNKRFFPGGENSIRGYQDGEASPLDPEGRQIGADAYALGHVEFEVSLLGSLAIVVFTDVLWATADFEDSPSGETLFSSGLGLRYSTPLGPLRLEYAHNLNPRPSDPAGTLHFSIGFPF